MNLLITGYFNDNAKKDITNVFPQDWIINIVEPEEIHSYIGMAEVLIPEHIQVTADLLEKAPMLKLVQTGAGYDNVDVDSCTRKGVWVCNSAGVNANAVAEHIMALALSYYKNIHKLDAFMKSNQDEKTLHYKGGELQGKTMGIIGCGAIGMRLAKFAAAFDMSVLGYDIHPKPNSPVVEYVELDTLIRNSDIITVNIFLNERTKHFVNEGFLKKMKADALLVNTSRGDIVCEEDLLEALQKGDIGGACLDVFHLEPLPKNHLLRSIENVILTPHTAGMPDGAKFHKKRYGFFISNINKVINNMTPLSNINNL